MESFRTGLPAAHLGPVPGPELATNVDEVLKETAITVSKKNGFQAEDVFIAKVVQFQELLDVRPFRHALGPAWCWKEYNLPDARGV